MPPELPERKISPPSLSFTVSTSNHYGLCRECKLAQIVTSAKGGEFVLCTYAKIDHSFPKYPTMPVLQCKAFVGSSMEMDENSA